MTQPPDWWSQLSPGIHNAPPRVPAPDPVAFTWQQLQQIVSGLVNEFLRQVAVALGAIEIFGFKPYEALVEIGENIAAAKANFDALLAGLSAGDIGGVLGYFGNLGVTGLYNAAAGFGNLSTSLLKNLTPTGGDIGQFDASALTGAINTALTFSGTVLSTLLQYLNSAGQFSAAQLTGALNGAVTFGGTALSTVLQYLNSSGQFNSAQLTGALNGAVTLGGVTLSTLVTNINSSGQILAAGITGALGTGLTVGGVTLSTLFTNINSSGQLLGAGITGAINTAATVAGQTVGTIQANAQGLIEGINNAAAGLLSGGSTLLADAQTNLNLLLTAPAQFLQGATGLFGIVPTQNAYAAAASAQAAQAANLAQQQSAFNAVFNVSPASAGNVNVTVDFSGMADAADMSGVMLPGNTSMGITSGAAKRQVTTTGDASEVFPTQTSSDYQVFSATLGPLNDISASNWTAIRGRVNSSQTSCVGVTLDTNSGTPRLRLYCEVGGVGTAFSSNSVPSMATGGVVKLILGDPSSLSPYAMQVLYNGTPVITYTDSSHVSQLGASYRYVGIKMSAVTSKYPPAIRTVSYQDNPPAPASYPHSGLPTPGTKGRRYVCNDVGAEYRDNGSAWELVRGGPLLYFTPPPSTSWSWVNQGGASTATELGGERITAPSGSRNWRLRTRSLSPTSNYTATAYVESSAATAASTWWSGIGLRNSSSTSFIMFGAYGDATAGRLVISRWTNSTTFSANSATPFVYQLAAGCMPNWLRIRDDGTNRYFEYSHNGVDWGAPILTEGRTTFITPDQFCFGADNEGTGSDVVVRLRSLAGIA